MNTAYIVRFLALVCCSLGIGCVPQPANLAPQQYGQGTPLLTESRQLSLNGETRLVSSNKEIYTGFFVPDGRGGYILQQGSVRPAPPATLVEAQELKLQLREMVDQLLATVNNDALLGYVALPTTFVNLNNFNDSSALGRYVAEGMFYEFNQRGFPIREYRLDKAIDLREGQGEFVLSRALASVPANGATSLLLVGTYYEDAAAVFINARLVRATDGMVLRTAQLTLPNNTLLARMLVKPAPPMLASSRVALRQNNKLRGAGQ